MSPKAEKHCAQMWQLVRERQVEVRLNLSNVWKSEIHILRTRGKRECILVLESGNLKYKRGARCRWAQEACWGITDTARIIYEEFLVFILHVQAAQLAGHMRSVLLSIWVMHHLRGVLQGVQDYSEETPLLSDPNDK